VIRLQGVCRSFRGQQPGDGVLRGVDLEVGEREMVAVVGPSGCGKTTLLHVMAGLDRRYTGTVVVGGQDLRRLSDAALADLRRRRLGIVFQSLHLLDHLTAVDNVALPWLFARGREVSGHGGARERAMEMLRLVGLGERARARPGELSGGERQRVALARALFNRPPLLLCDELTGNLDRETGAVVLARLDEVRRGYGGAVVVVTHDPDLVEAADRVLELAGGRLRSRETGPS